MDPRIQDPQKRYSRFSLPVFWGEKTGRRENREEGKPGEKTGRVIK
jgi:hypothetical protein